MVSAHLKFPRPQPSSKVQLPISPTSNLKSKIKNLKIHREKISAALDFFKITLDVPLRCG
jgi:hypothetical protein